MKRKTISTARRWLCHALLAWLTAIPAAAQHKSGNLAIDIAHKSGDNRTSNVNIGIFGAAQYMHGAQINLFSSSAKEMRGAQVAGIA